MDASDAVLGKESVQEQVNKQYKEKAVRGTTTKLENNMKVEQRRV